MEFSLELSVYQSLGNNNETKKVTGMNTSLPIYINFHVPYYFTRHHSAFIYFS